MRHGLMVCAMLGGMLGLAAMAKASPPADWPVYRADTIAYAQNLLPMSVIVYVFTSDMTLAGVIDNAGLKEAEQLQRIAEAVGTRRFPAPVDAQPDALAQSVGYFLRDQGYRLDEVVSDRTRYTLLLVLPHVKPTDCAYFTTLNQKYKDAVHKATSGLSGVYSVAILELASPKAKLSCAG